MKKLMALVISALLLQQAAAAQYVPEGEEYTRIKTFLAACADIAEFDIKNYDYDRLFKYVLYTHENFRVLTDIDDKTTASSSMGYNRVVLVSGEYIDYIMENIFNLTPEKPPLTSLNERGFCYNEGYYLYTGGFKMYFSTDITGIDNVSDLGGGAMLVTFSDIYTEGTRRKNEKSFAIIRDTGNGGYSLLRLGMGEKAPDEKTALSYAPFSYKTGINWNDVPSSPADTRNARQGFWLPFMLFICAAGIFGAALCIALIMKSRD